MVPYTRGKERSRTSSSVLDEARRIADLGFTEIQLLGQNVNSYRDPEGKMSFAELLAAVGAGGRHKAGAVYDQPPAGLYAGHCGGDRRVSDALRPRASAGAVGFGTGAEDDGAGVHAGLVPGADFRGSRRRKRPISLSTDIIVGFPGETDDDFIETMNLLAEVEYDCVFAFKYSARPNTPSLVMIDTVPEEEKAKRLQVLLERQREIQRVNYSKQIGDILEVMVEGANPAARADFGAQHAEQASEHYLDAAHRACAGKLPASADHGSVS